MARAATGGRWLPPCAPRGPSTTDHAFLQEMQQGGRRDGWAGERGHPPPLRQDPLRFPTLERKLRDRRLLGEPPVFCRRNPQFCRDLWKSAGDGEGVDIPFDAVKARSASGAKGGRQKGEEWLGAYRLELQLSHPLCAERPFTAKIDGSRSCETGSGLRCRGQKGIPITYMCLQISAEGGRWRTGEMWECGNGWIDLWVTGRVPCRWQAVPAP